MDKNCTHVVSEEDEEKSQFESDFASVVDEAS